MKGHAQVDHAMSRVGDSAGDTGGDHDEERRAARDGLPRRRQLMPRHDDGRRPVDRKPERMPAHRPTRIMSVHGPGQRDAPLARGDMEVSGDNDEECEADRNGQRSGGRRRREGRRRPVKALRARRRDEESGAHPGDLAVQGGAILEPTAAVAMMAARGGGRARR